MKKRQLKIDYILLICVLLLAVIGVFMVYSASSYSASINFNNKYHFLTKQIIGDLIGVGLLVLFMFINIEKTKKLKYVFLGLSIIMLAIVFIPGIGKTSYGANRWINLGFATLQPSEIAKFGFIMYSAGVMADMKTNPKTFKAMLPVLLAGCSICLLIILEPNMSITMCVGMVMLIMLFVGGSGIKNMLLITIPIILMVPVLIIIEPYRLQRLSAFLDPWSSPLEEGFQLIQSYYALGSGGWFGVGYGNSRQKFLFLPFAESDFIFSVIGEELGFIFAGLILVLYVIIIFRGFKIALNADTRYKCYLATGITALIGVQTLINIAVVTGSIPPTGLPLPFISAGSTSLIAFFGAVGMLLSCSIKSSPNDKVFIRLKQ